MKVVRPLILAMAIAGAFFYFTTWRSNSAGELHSTNWLSRPDQVEITEAAQGETLDGEEQNNISVYKKNIPSVVNVTSRAMTFDFFYGLVPQEGQGSGFVIDKEGHILTNYHVIADARQVEVTMHNRKKYKATVVGTDPSHDLAVIQIKAPELVPAVLGDSRNLQVGQKVYAIGNPFGLAGTMTRGIVSSIRPVREPNGAMIDEAIQTDAAINPGNSGGPLVNARGEVVGINTFLISPSGTFSGMGFAIPSQIVRPTVETLIRDGKVRHGHMGIGIADVTPENAKFFGDKAAMGGVVTQVEADSPAAKAGLQIGDVITEIDGHKVNDAGELQVIVGQKQPGTKIDLKVLRDGKTQAVPVTLEELGSHNGEGTSAPGESNGKMRWGLGLGNLTPELRDQLQAPSDIHGAVIEQVQPGSPADNAGLQQGDVILEVNRHKVQSASDVQQALSSVDKGQDALVLVWSNGGNSFRVLHSGDGA